MALQQGERTASYAVLHVRSDCAAAALRAQGIGPGGRVGLHVARSIESVAGSLAILKTGAAVVPLPPTDPELRLREVASLASLDAVVTSADAPFPGAGRPPVLALEELEAWSGAAGGASPGADDPAQPAFVLSSSGSTGRPKLIVRSHRSFFHRLEWTWSRHPFADGELGVQKAHATTTHSVYELFEPLLAGAPTFVSSDAEARDLEGFWETIRRRRVTRLLIVPSALRASFDLPGFRPPDAVKVVVLMGEHVPRELAARAAESFAPRTSLYSIYGSTEASSALVTDLRAAREPGRELPQGAPIAPEVRALVLDDDHRPVARGREGRLYLGGPQLFTEYLGDRAATDAVLVRLPGERGVVYDTRDRVRVDDDGALRFVARVDHMVKIRGFRVDLADVERALAAHPGVREAAAVAAQLAGQSTLVGFYAPAGIERAAVYATLRARLPPHMVPSALHGVERLPLTPSGKIDRVRLADLLAASGGAAAAASAPGASAPHTAAPTQRVVLELWARTLGHGTFDLDSDFFEVGGTSLSVFTLVRGLREAFGLSAAALSAETVYRHPTPTRLATHVDAVRSGSTQPEAGPAPVLVGLRRGREDLPPLFVVAPAGGTLGAYEKLAHALRTERAVIGLRDPFILGQRRPTESFDAWVDLYLAAIRVRQPAGPYFLCAYSSAGAFGYELARRLRAAGADVPLLALVDPQALAKGGRANFGYWALEAVWMGAAKRALVRTVGRLRTPVVRAFEALRGGADPTPVGVSEDEVQRLAAEALADRGHLVGLSVLMELNTGRPFALSEGDLAGLPPERTLDALHARVASLAPELDRETLERIAVQYQLQIRTQHRYRLSRYDGPVLLVEPVSPYAGLLAELLRPFVKQLRVRTLQIGPPSERTAQLARRFGALQAHYRCMRDDAFVARLAADIDAALG